MKWEEARGEEDGEKECKKVESSLFSYQSHHVGGCGISFGTVEVVCLQDLLLVIIGQDSMGRLDQVAGCKHDRHCEDDSAYHCSRLFSAAVKFLLSVGI